MHRQQPALLLPLDYPLSLMLLYQQSTHNKTPKARQSLTFEADSPLLGR